MTPFHVRAVWTGSVLALLLGAASPALADVAAANRCASNLSPEARAIYKASAPKLVNGADGRAVVTEQTRKLVLSGKLDHLKANEADMAAAGCLMLR